MAELFTRVGSITVIPPDETVGVEFKGLRFSFDFIKTVESTPNNAKFTIFNIAQENRALFEAKDSKVICRLGWAGRGVYTQSKEFLAGDGQGEICFIGNIIENGYTLEKKGPDIAISIECSTALVEMRDSTINKSYAAGTKVKTIVDDIVDSMGLKLNFVPSGVDFGSFLKGTVLSGDSKDMLSKLLDKAGLNWSIQDDELQITEPNKPASTNAILITRDTGLIGSVTKRKDGTLLFKTLLNPKIKPNTLIELRSTNYSGNVMPNKVHYKGDFEGNSYDCEIEAKEV